MENLTSKSVSCDCNIWERDILSRSLEELMDMTTNQNLWPLFVHESPFWGPFPTSKEGIDNVAIHAAIMKAEGLKSLKESLIMYQNGLKPNLYIENGIKFLIASHNVEVIIELCHDLPVDFRSIVEHSISFDIKKIGKNISGKSDEKWTKDNYTNKDTRKISKESGKRLVASDDPEVTEEKWERGDYISDDAAKNAKSNAKELGL